MPAKLYRVDLTASEQTELERLRRKGTVSAGKMKRAQILLKAAEGWRDEDIMLALSTSRARVERTRRRFVEGDLQRALNEDERPDNQARWSMRLLADKLVELGVVDSISHEAVRQTLKKMRSNPGK